VPKLNLSSVIDAIVLEVTGAGINGDAESLEASIGERTVAHLTRLLEDGAVRKADVDSVSPMIIRGVLRRLEQIAVNGGQIGSA
jgi:hypothetical protein